MTEDENLKETAAEAKGNAAADENITDNKTLSDTENSTSETEVELNDEGEPRPPVDPKNGLYTLLSLLIFAVLYIGYHLITANVFSPRPIIFTEPDETQQAYFAEIADADIPTGGTVSYARLNSYGEGGELFIRYENIDPEIFADTVNYPLYIAEEEQRTAVYRDETGDMDYVYADIYYPVDGHGGALRIYEYEDTNCAEFVLGDYPKELRRRLLNEKKKSRRAQTNE